MWCSCSTSEHQRTRSSAFSILVTFEKKLLGFSSISQIRCSVNGALTPAHMHTQPIDHEGAATSIIV